MATKAEREKLSAWAEQVRVAATWVQGPKRRKLLKLADAIDPEVDAPPEPEVDPAPNVEE
jgi:hypothetical protein